MPAKNKKSIYDTPQYLPSTEFILSNVNTDDEKTILENDLLLGLINGMQSNDIFDKYNNDTNKNTKILYDEVENDGSLLFKTTAIDTKNFIIKSEFSRNEIADHESIVYSVGNNTFDGINEIKKTISLSNNSSSFLNQTLVFDNKPVWGPWSSVDPSNCWSIDFKSINPNSLLSLAINSNYNNHTKKSLVTIKEDTFFNTNLSFAKLDHKFDNWFESDSRNIEIKKLNKNNVPYENKIVIDFNEENMSDPLIFGTYKFVQNQANIGITHTGLDSNPFEGLAISLELCHFPLKSILDYSKFQEFFNNDIEKKYNNQNYTLSVNQTYTGTGYTPNFTGIHLNSSVLDPSYSTVPFTLDSTKLIDNFAYMKNNYATMNNTIKITQTPITINSNNSLSNGKDLFSISNYGEKLDLNYYNKKANLSIKLDTNTNRIKDDTNNSGRYSDVNVYYELDNTTNHIGDKEKTYKDVTYNIKNIARPTGYSQYSTKNTCINDFNSDSTLYLTNPTNYDIKLSSTIKSKYPATNVASYITVNVSSQLAEDVDALLILRDNDVMNVDAYDNNNANQIPLHIDITSSGNNNQSALNYDIYRVLLKNKTVNELNYSTPTQNCKLIMGVDGSDPFLTTSAVTSIDSLFSSSDYYDFITNNTDMTLEFEYTSLQTQRSVFQSNDNVNIYLVDSNNERTLLYTVFHKDMTFSNQSLLSTSEPVLVTQTDYKDRNIYFHAKTQTYQSTFLLRLGAYRNLYVQTPILKSTTSFYTSNSKTNGKHLIFPAKKALPPGIYDYGAVTESIVIDGGSALTSRITFKASCISSFIGKIQATNVDLSTWTYVSDSIDIDTYYDTNSSFARDENYGEINVVIKPHNDAFVSPDFSGNYLDFSGNINSLNDDNFILHELYYAIPLNFETNPNYEVKGYSYHIDNLSGFNTETLFTPVPINNKLPRHPNHYSPMNLSLKFDYETYTSNNKLVNGFTLTIIDNNLNQPIATIESNITGITQSFTIFSLSNPIFVIDESCQDPVKTQYDTTMYVIGDESVSSGYSNGISSGNLTNNNGILLSYTDIQLNDEIKFSLKSDKLKINLVGDLNEDEDSTYINHLLWQYSNDNNNGFDKLMDTIYIDVANNELDDNVSEVITIPNYRGYKYSASYYFNRMDNEYTATYEVSEGTTQKIKCDYGSLYTNHEYNTYYNNSIGSIGLKLNTKWSRLPKSFFANGQNVIYVPVLIDTDRIQIKETYNDDNIVLSDKTVKSTDHNLYTFPKSVYTIVTGRVTNNVSMPYTYTINYQKGALDLYKSDAFFGSPTELNYQLLESYPFQIGKNGISAVKNFMTFTPQMNVSSDSSSYLVFASPGYIARQTSINYSKVLPIKQDTLIDSNQQYDIRFSAINYDSILDTYKPFSSFVELTPTSLNDIIFTNNNPKSYLDFFNNPDTNVYTFDVKGTTTKMYVNLGLNNNTTSSSPDTIIYDGFIVDLPREPSLTNPYKLEAILDDVTGEYSVKFCQNILPGANDYAGFSLNDEQNIKFVIGGQTFENNGKEPNLLSESNYINLQVYDGTKTSIYSLGNYIGNSGYTIRLMKLTTNTVQYNLLPITSTIHNLNFIDIIPLTDGGVKYIDITMDKLNEIIGLNTNILNDTPFNLIQFIQQNLTIEKFSTFISDNPWMNVSSNTGFTFDPTSLSTFLFRIIATSNIGQYKLTDLFTVNESHNTKFTYISNPDILTVLSSDGLPVVRIAANGVISSQTNITNLQILNPLQNIIVNPLQNPPQLD